MGVVDDTRCHFCNNERDSIQHIFGQCDCIRHFWNKLETLLRDKCETDVNVHFTENLVSLFVRSALVFLPWFSVCYCFQISYDYADGRFDSIT